VHRREGGGTEGAQSEAQGCPSSGDGRAKYGRVSTSNVTVCLRVYILEAVVDSVQLLVKYLHAACLCLLHVKASSTRRGFEHKLLKKHCRRAGQAIARRVCEASFFKESFTAAVYLTAPRLREVDTSEVVKCLLGATGTPLRPAHAACRNDTKHNKK
jgi:hypothetical protein